MREARSEEGKTVQQCRKIWAQARERGLDDEALHELVWAVTGREHISTLSKEQAGRVIEVLSGLESGRCPVRMRSKILALMYTLGWDLKRLRGFVRRQAGVEDLSWLDKSGAMKVIEGQKAILARAEDASKSGD